MGTQNSNLRPAIPESMQYVSVSGQKNGPALPWAGVRNRRSPMQLYTSLTSPFARKVRVAVIEKRLSNLLETVVVDPWASPDELLRSNPLSQVPTLLLDNGLPLTNSDTIIDWLERHYPNPALLPADEQLRTQALAIAALTQGLIECTVDIVLERRKTPAQQGQAMIERRLTTIDRVVDTLAIRFDVDTHHFYLDGIGVACALAYLDLRVPERNWRERSKQLTAWQAWAAERDSMRATQPPP